MAGRRTQPPRAPGIVASMRILLTALLAIAACGGTETTCTASYPCSQSGTWQVCNDGNVEFYKTSDGQQFHCANIADCNAAAMQMANWCENH